MNANRKADWESRIDAMLPAAKAYAARHGFAELQRATLEARQRTGRYVGTTVEAGRFCIHEGELGGAHLAGPFTQAEAVAYLDAL